MKRLLTIAAIVAGAVAVYTTIVLLIGYSNMAVPIQFGRVSFATAGVILFAPTLLVIFRATPAPRRDFLYVGIFLLLASLVCFGFWNQAGRIFGLDTSVFTSPIPGFFSLMAVIGAGFCVSAPDMGGRKHRIIAVTVGAVAATAVVVAPLFR